MKIASARHRHTHAVKDKQCFNNAAGQPKGHTKGHIAHHLTRNSHASKKKGLATTCKHHYMKPSQT